MIPRLNRILDSAKARTQDITRAEGALAILLLALAVGLRVLLAWHYRIDSDEPQHLHVVWGWTRGLLPYRDIFDNHAPIFQALSAPLFHFLGVRADVVLPMRLAMIPLFAVAVWCVWRITATISTRREALWTALLALFFPPFFLTSIEFRPDQLWTLVWLLALTVCVTGRATQARAFAVGLLLGLAFSVSMKSTLMAAALALACGGSLLLGWRPRWTRVAKLLGAALLGVVLAPGMVVLYFVCRGAGPQMFYCVIAHNILPSAAGAGGLLRSALHWLGWWPVIILGTWLIGRSGGMPEQRARLGFVFLAGAFYISLLFCFWPIIEAETRLPFYPVIAISLVPALLRRAERARLPGWVLPALLAAGEITVIAVKAAPFTDATKDRIGLVADTLKLTDEDDYVMDGKGEMIYRRRPFYYVLEGLTIKRLALGLIRDDIRERLVETRTPLATTRRMPGADSSFIRANYLPIAFRLSVLGKELRKADAGAFEIAVPGRYTLVSESGDIAGEFDGTPFAGPRELAPGRHIFRQTAGAGRVALVWARAIERGYSPFAAIKADYTTSQD